MLRSSAVRQRLARPSFGRFLSSKAPLVKSLAAEQKAITDAVSALGPSPSYAALKGVMETEAHAATMAKVTENDMSWTWAMMESKPTKPAVTVTVAGAGSAVGSAALYRIAAGEMLGSDTPVMLQLIGADAAVVKDLEACGFPLLKGVSSASDLKGAAYAILLEGDFAALGKSAGKGALLGVAGNTNALAVSKAAPGASVTAITRAPQLATEIALAKSAGVAPMAVSNVISWGSGIADVSHAVVDGKWAMKLTDGALATSEVTTSVAAEAVVAHMKDWALGSGGKWVSMGVPAVGDYGMGEGFFFSVPVVCEPGAYKRIGGVSMTAEVATALEASRTALAAEAAKL